MRTDKDTLGTRLKGYERVFTSQKVDNKLPIYARLDGRSFSKFTRSMKRPFDSDMIHCMQKTTIYLMEETNADIGYCQSDEISLLWLPSDNPLSQFMFDGKIQKLASVLASLCASKFLVEFLNYFELKTLPSFDCRILNLSSTEEAFKMIYWRQIDAFKNSVQSAAHYKFGHKKLMYKTTNEKLDMLEEEKINFFMDYPPEFRVGTYFTWQRNTYWADMKEPLNRLIGNAEYERKYVVADCPLSIEEKYVDRKNRDYFESNMQSSGDGC